MATTDVSNALGTAVAHSAPTPDDGPPPRSTIASIGFARAASIVATLMIASLLAGLDLTMLPAAMAKSAGSYVTAFGSTATLAYLAATVIGIPVFGKLGDVLGPKRPFQVAVAVFIVGAALLAWKPGPVDLVVPRTMQGVGVGGLMVGAIVIVLQTGPPRRRATGTALVLATFALSFALGPVVAKTVDAHHVVAWSLYGEILLASLTLVLTSTTVPRVRRADRTIQKLDLVGALLLGVASTGVVVAARWERLGTDWNSTLATGLAAATLLVILLFVLVERNVSEPLVPLRLLHSRTCALTGIVGLIVGAAVFGAMANVFAVAQQVKGTSTAKTLVLAAPLAGGLAVAAVCAGALLARAGRHRLVAVPGALVTAVGLGGLALMASDSPQWQDMASMAALGVGTGLLLPVLVLAAQSASPRDDAGVVGAAAVYVRQLGAYVGAGAFGALSPAIAPQRAFSYAVPPIAVAAILALLFRERPMQDATIAVIPFPGQKAGPGRADDNPSAGPHSYDEAAYERSGASQCSRFDPTAHLDDTHGEHRNDIRVQVRQADGRPVPGVVLTLCDLAGSELGRSVALGDGGYVLTAPDTGAYLVIASVQGYHPLAQVVSVRAPLTEVDLDLSGESGTFGVVRNSTGDPVAGATVALADPLGEVVARASTGLDGSFALTDLRPGAYTLAVSALGYRPAARALRVPDTGRVHQTVELVGGGHLHGTVRGIAGNPLRDARVTLVDAWGRVARETASGPSGHYRFAEVAEGDYTVVASMYPPTATRVHVAGGQQHQHDMELTYPDV